MWVLPLSTKLPLGRNDILGIQNLWFVETELRWLSRHNTLWFSIDRWVNMGFKVLFNENTLLQKHECPSITNASSAAVEACKLLLRRRKALSFSFQEKLRNYCMCVFKNCENTRNQGGLSWFTVVLRELVWKPGSVAPFLSCFMCFFNSSSSSTLFLLVLYSGMSKRLL